MNEIWVGLAEKVGVTFQQIQKYESGYTTLNIIRLQYTKCHEAAKFPASSEKSS